MFNVEILNNLEGFRKYPGSFELYLYPNTHTADTNYALLGKTMYVFTNE